MTPRVRAPSPLPRADFGGRTHAVSWQINQIEASPWCDAGAGGYNTATFDHENGMDPGPKPPVVSCFLFFFFSVCVSPRWGSGPRPRA